jgi:hypothetical protein
LGIKLEHGQKGRKLKKNHANSLAIRIMRDGMDQQYRTYSEGEMGDN